MNVHVRNLVGTVEWVARSAAATFLSVWLISAKVDLKNVQYAGGAALVTAASSLLVVFGDHGRGPTVTLPNPTAPKPE